MQRSSRRQTILLIVVLLTLTACSSVFNPGPTPTPFGTYQLATYYRSLYERMGGEPVIGKAISPLFTHDKSFCQYTENLLYCFDPTAKVEAERISVVELGTLLKLPKPPQPPPIYPGFKATYEALFGERYVGKPLTGVSFNKDKRRIEQYFEKMGFYQLIDDPRGTVRLMAYGVYACNGHCDYPLGTDSAVGGRSVEVPPMISLERLGGFKVFGSPLSLPYTATDGNTEQLFENALVYVPRDDPTTIRLRPIAKDLRARLEAPVPEPSSPSQGTVFYPTADGVGYAVPVVFDEFIASHGGKEISGAPTSSAFRATINGSKIPGQCFENYCLYYNAEAAAESKVGLMSLGRQYRDKVDPAYLVPEFSPKTVKILLSELKLQVSASEEQVIQIKIEDQNSQPISAVEGILVVGLPDGRKPAYSFPPTDMDGSSSVTLLPVKNAANGTVIPYVVCLNVPSTSNICAGKTYLIWNVK